MNINQDYEIANARFDIDSFFVLKDKDKLVPLPITFKEPVGKYTIDPTAIYAGKTYTLALRLSGIQLAGMDNTYHLELSKGYVVEKPYFEPKINSLIVTVALRSSVVPTLDPFSLPGSLWDECNFHLYINDILVGDKDHMAPSLPVSFNTGLATASGEAFYLSDKAFMLIQPSETVFLDIISGAGAGAGLNLIKGENQSGENGGDATLCYIDPLDGEVKPLVHIEGGLGGRLSSHAHQDFKDRTCKCRVFADGYITPFSFVEVIEREHHQPVRDITVSTGGLAHQSLLGCSRAKGGDGGMKDDIGFRGEGGISGGRMVVQIQHKPNAYGTPGPLIILHPKTMVNVHGVIEDKDLKIKKTKTPMVGGKGGASLTQPGEDGQDGTLLVSI